MFEIIKKDDFWAGLDDAEVYNALGGTTTRALDGLKYIQDVWTLHQLRPFRNSRILEIGGGDSRVLRGLDQSNELWNLDEFVGDGNGLINAVEIPGVRLVRRKLGDFASELPDAYFDVCFSLSVIEHIPPAPLAAFWKDHARIMKPGGHALHTIDFYLADDPAAHVESRLDLYMRLPRENGFDFVRPPAVKRPLAFTCDMASNTDWGMWNWNRYYPEMKAVRRNHQSVSLGCLLKKL
jgi:hypothetical protein